MGHRLRLGVGAPQSYPLSKSGGSAVFRVFRPLDHNFQYYNTTLKLPVDSLIVEHNITFHLVYRSSLWDEYN